jgi:GNAT superfamily N-acetyltransferase
MTALHTGSPGSPGSAPALVAEVAPARRDSILAHLLELDAGDRRLRFGLTVSDDSIRKYVQSIDFRRDVALGVFDQRGRLIGFGHLGLCAEGPAEFGLSVRRAERLRGIGGLLLQRAARVAAARGYTALVMFYVAENGPLARVALRAGMQLTPDLQEATAVLALPVAAPGALLRLALDEAVNSLDLGFRHLAGLTAAAAEPA